MRLARLCRGWEREGGMVGGKGEWVSIGEPEEKAGEVKNGGWRLGRPQAKAAARRPRG